MVEPRETSKHENKHVNENLGVLRGLAKFAEEGDEGLESGRAGNVQEDEERWFDDAHEKEVDLLGFGREFGGGCHGRFENETGKDGREIRRKFWEGRERGQEVILEMYRVAIRYLGWGKKIETVAGFTDEEKADVEGVMAELMRFYQKWEMPLCEALEVNHRTRTNVLEKVRGLVRRIFGENAYELIRDYRPGYVRRRDGTLDVRIMGNVAFDEGDMRACRMEFDGLVVLFESSVTRREWTTTKERGGIQSNLKFIQLVFRVYTLGALFNYRPYRAYESDWIQDRRLYNVRFQEEVVVPAREYFVCAWRLFDGRFEELQRICLNFMDPRQLKRGWTD